MKLRSAPLDDVFGELQFALDEDGRRRARIVRRCFTWAYRALKLAMLATLRLNWRQSQRIPELGAEPFNLTDAELAREWRER